MNKFHEVGIKVLGDAVLNHRCAHYQNENGVWNVFGGRLNWDARAVVADDPHFQVYSLSVFQMVGTGKYLFLELAVFFFLSYLFCYLYILFSKD